MLRTILVGSCVFVQGVFVKNLDDGRIAVRVDGQVFSGHPVANEAAA